MSLFHCDLCPPLAADLHGYHTEIFESADLQYRPTSIMANSWFLQNQCGTSVGLPQSHSGSTPIPKHRKTHETSVDVSELSKTLQSLQDVAASYITVSLCSELCRAKLLLCLNMFFYLHLNGQETVLWISLFKCKKTTEHGVQQQNKSYKSTDLSLSLQQLIRQNCICPSL